MSLSLKFAAGSHTGMIRDHNEDSGYAGPRLLAIADGMGGQAAGEVASSEVISTFVPLDDDIPGSDILTSLDDSVQRANTQLRTMVEEDTRLDGMGTTLTALLWTGRRLGLVHVGDSRAYLLRDGLLTQITQDHTWVQRLVDEGRITEEEATTHPQRSLLMRALGSADHIEADLSIREVRAGDRYLLCSDGLSGVVSHETLQDTLDGFAPPQDTVRELIELALRGGGPDNITCIVADVLDVDTQEGETLAQQLYDAPQIVGAVAETQTQPPDGAPQTPAARAAELGRPQAAPAPGAAPGAGAGEAPAGAAIPPQPDAPPHRTFGAFTDEDYLPRRSGRHTLRRVSLIGLALLALGAALYAGYRWTQSQYFIAANGEHVAVYQGISQDLGPLSLSSVEEDYPEIELRYLSGLQQSQIQESIPADSLSDAHETIGGLSDQADLCRLVAEQEAGEREQAEETEQAEERERQKEEEAAEREQNDGRESGQGGDGRGGQDQNDSSAAAEPSPGPTLTEKQRQDARKCETPAAP